ncbi:Uncharacterised protein (plasmid) [Legionella adelaidensis]|uniref:Uncharacterized protein n=1 Tax=Legionella adelaidensis TaxID=45056 RepID=A0A0W0R1E4_9GAMM|nr:hypothetical protein [Legionella adelaidensis]KTC64913.1 hypothetical protein Lade_1720 [Legionella adelaidensis]VEH85596.1 Uncharacterised protein [Legionella adelaidensis]
MEPVAIAIIGTVVFGAVTALSVFIRQILLSRDKNLNDKAQHRALAQETRELEKLRKQLESGKRYDSHYQVLGVNKEAIQYIDQKIEEILSKKMALITRYTQVVAKESSAIIDGAHNQERKVACDLLKQEIDQEIKFYDSELQQLQARRSAIWDAHGELLGYLTDQEKSRNQILDTIYQSHSNVLEKIYLRHNEIAEHIATKSIDAGTDSFKIITSPLRMLLDFFRSRNISPDRAVEEIEARKKVQNAEADINEAKDEIEKENEKTPELSI